MRRGVVNVIPLLSLQQSLALIGKKGGSKFEHWGTPIRHPIPGVNVPLKYYPHLHNISATPEGPGQISRWETLLRNHSGLTVSVCTVPWLHTYYAGSGLSIHQLCSPLFGGRLVKYKMLRGAYAGDMKWRFLTKHRREPQGGVLGAQGIGIGTDGEQSSKTASLEYVRTAGPISSS
jgi:hypothetical protein